MELLKQRAQVSMLHIPYRGGAPAVNDLLAGHAQVMIINPDIVLPHVQIGRSCILKKCIIDKNCVIPEGTRIGVDPAADRKRFHVTPSGITLVSREMLGQDVSPLR